MTYRVRDFGLGVALSAGLVAPAVAQDIDRIYRCHAPSGCVSSKKCPEGLDAFLIVLTTGEDGGRMAAVSAAGSTTTATILDENDDAVTLRVTRRAGMPAFTRISIGDDLEGLISLRRSQGPTRKITMATTCDFAAPGEALEAETG